MKVVTTTLILSLATLTIQKQVKVYESTSPLYATKVLSGLQLSNPNLDVDIGKMPGISYCIRFNYKRLMHSKSRLAGVQSKDWSWSLLQFLVGYWYSFTAFGTYDELRGIPGWIQQVVGAKNFLMWSANRWHHICVSFAKKDNHIMFIKVSKKT